MYQISYKIWIDLSLLLIIINIYYTIGISVKLIIPITLPETSFVDGYNKLFNTHGHMRILILKFWDKNFLIY